MTRTRVLPIVFLTLAAPAAAQPSITASVGPDLASTSESSGASRQFAASVGVEQLAKAERVRLFYDFDAGDYASPGDWHFLVHSGGASYRLGVGKARNLYVGGDATFRRNGDAWEAADYNAAAAYANFELHPARATVRTGYRFDLRRFPTFRALDQMEHTAFGSVLTSFETRTTLIGEVILGAKHYDAVSGHTEVIAGALGPPAERGLQQGRRAGLSDVALIPIVTPGTPGADARQVTFLGRTAQSLADRTGVSVEVSRRQVFGEVPPAVVTTPPSFFDDGIYDDLFASNATRGTMTLKVLAPSGLQLQVSAMALAKDYPATYAYDDTGVILPDVRRSDQVMQARIETMWPLLPSRTGPAALDLVAGYEYTRHRSTSAIYRYTAHTVRLAFNVTY